MGQFIRDARIKQGITLRELARRVGVSPPFLSDLEHGRRTTSKLPEIETELGLAVGTLEDMSGQIPPDLKKWISENPGVVALLREVREWCWPCRWMRAGNKKYIGAVKGPALVLTNSREPGSSP